MSDLLKIGTRSLLAYQAALNVVGQNIANVNTPFYSRRQVDFREAIYNNGVNLSDVRRVFDEAASRNLQKANSELVSSETYFNALKSLETVFGDSLSADPNNSNSIGKFINDSIKALNQLNTSPQDIQSRSLYLSQLNNLTSRFKQLSGQILLKNNSINTALSADATKVNQITSQLKDINIKMKSSTSEDYSALLDQRESLLQDLATVIDFNKDDLDDGQINITLKNGTPLVFGFDNYNLSTIPDSENPNNQIIVVTVGNNTTPVTNAITSGEIGGLLQFRNDLSETDRSLNRLSLAISDTINSQNKLGIDINGNLGKNIFTDINNPSLIAARTIKNTNNSGSANISVNIDDVTKLTSSDYKLQFDAANHYTLTRISDGAIVSSAAIAAYPADISIDGFTATIDANTFSVGDTFTLSPTKNAASNISIIMTDPASLALAFPVKTNANTSNTGTGKISVNSITNTSNSSFSTPLKLNPPIKVEFLSDSSYQLINLNDNSIIEGPLTYNPANGSDIFPTPGGYDPGYRISMSGEMKSGDTFTIDYNNNASGDNRNGLAMAQLFQTGILENGKSSFTQAYNFITTDVSVKANSANWSFQSSSIVYTQAQTNYESISGVSIGEETVNLAEYQQAYQASAQILQTARTIFDIILSLSRGQ